MESIQYKAQKMNIEHKRHRWWLNLVSVLASVTLFCTVYALIIPATTQSTEVYCGFEEHAEHSQECYSEMKVLICNQEECAGHEHNDDCYEESLVLSCTCEDSDHIHTDSCYTVQRILICDQAEAEAHAHTESCYEIQKSLICERSIHVHSLQCHSNPDADVENEIVWSRLFNDLEFTGNKADDIVLIAKSQLNYRESERNYLVLEDGESMNGYTRYGAWYGDPYGDWDAMFCSFCIHYAGIEQEILPYGNEPRIWLETLRNEPYGYYQPYDESVEPKSGELIFFDDDKDGEADRVGIVSCLTRQLISPRYKIKAIEGDSDNRVRERYYELDDQRILGLVHIPEEDQEYTDFTAGAITDEVIIRNDPLTIENDPIQEHVLPDSEITGKVDITDDPFEEDTEETTFKEPDPIDTEELNAEVHPQEFELIEPTEIRLEAECSDGVKVTLITTSDALPYPADQITLTIVRLYDADSNSSCRYDICLNRNGEEIEPTGIVSVLFSGLVAIGDEPITVHHVDPNSNETEDMGAVVNDDGTIEMSTNHFSEYSINGVVPLSEGLDIPEWESDVQIYITLEKVFNGLNLDEIPDDFLITVEGPDKNYRLKPGVSSEVDRVIGLDPVVKEVPGSSKKEITCRWQLLDVALGEFNIYESNCSVDGYDLIANGTGRVETKKPPFSIVLIDDPGIQHNCSTKYWPVMVTEDQNQFFACTLTNSSTAIITEKPLSAAQQYTVNKWFTEVAGSIQPKIDGWNNCFEKRCVFFSIEHDADENGDIYLDNQRVVNCKERPGYIYIKQTKYWQHVGAFGFCVEAADNPELQLTNTYKGSAELPHTGGSGTLPYKVCGFALIGSAILYGYIQIRRVRRKNEN